MKFGGEFAAKPKKEKEKHMSKISLSIAFHLWSSRKTKDDEEIQMIGIPTPLEFHVKLPELNGVKQQAHHTSQ